MQQRTRSGDRDQEDQGGGSRCGGSSGLRSCSPWPCVVHAPAASASSASSRSLARSTQEASASRAVVSRQFVGSFQNTPPHQQPNNNRLCDASKTLESRALKIDGQLLKRLRRGSHGSIPTPSAGRAVHTIKSQTTCRLYQTVIERSWIRRNNRHTSSCDSLMGPDNATVGAVALLQEG